MTRKLLDTYFKTHVYRTNESVAGGHPMHFEALRLATFFGWPDDAAPWPSDLAKTGLYYEGRGDEVRCFSCKKTLGHWRLEDEPRNKHLTLYRDCPLMSGQETRNVPFDSLHETTLSEPSSSIFANGVTRTRNMDDPIDYTVDRADFPISSRQRESIRPIANYQRVPNRDLPEAIFSNAPLKREKVRRETFIGWPSNSPVQPDSLAQTGLYYYGDQDRVKCVFCENVLRGWERGDVPRTEHGRLYPDCPFVLGMDVGNTPIDRDDQPVDRVFIQNILENQQEQSQQQQQQQQQQQNQSSNASLHVVNTTRPQDNGISSQSRITSNATTGEIRTDLTSGASGLSTSSRVLTTSGLPAPSRVPTNSELPTPARVPTNSGLSTTSTSTNRTSWRAMIKREKVRRETFIGWPSDSPVHPDSLARAGLYYLGNSDRVKCAFCQNFLRGWEQGDDPDIEHERLFPDCSFVLELNVGNVPTATDDQPVDRVYIQSMIRREEEQRTATVLPHNQQQRQRQQLQRQQQQQQRTPPQQPTSLHTLVRRSRHPQYAREVFRLATFEGFPRNCPIEPKTLAAAGFFYIGEQDAVRCFHCDMGVRHWEPGDEPWEEHARWYTRCDFLKMSKGAEFIQQTQQKYAQRGSANSQNSSASVASASAVAAAAAAEENEMSDENVIRENQKLKEQKVCKICLEKEADIVLLPCGHLCCCSNCANRLSDCPVCRTVINGTVKIFMS